MDFNFDRSVFKPAHDFIRASGVGAKVCIVGAYDYLYPSAVRLFVADLPSTSQIIIDTIGTVEKTAKSMARRLHIQYKEIPAEWREYGQEAAIIRNQHLAKENLCCLVAFLSGHRSKRADKIIEHVMEEKIPVFLFNG